MKECTLKYEETLHFKTEEARDLALKCIKKSIELYEYVRTDKPGKFFIIELDSLWHFDMSDMLFGCGMTYADYPSEYKSLPYNIYSSFDAEDKTKTFYPFGIHLAYTEPAFKSEQTETLYPYMIFFSHHEGKEWICAAGYMLAKNEESIEGLLKEHYGEVRLRSIQKVDAREGTILYGERWKTLNG